MRKNKKIRKTNTDLIVRDWLAIDRTRMANERTFLAYLRTFIVTLSSGIAIMRVEALEELYELGIFLLGLSPVVFVIGFARFLYVKRHIRKYHTTVVSVEKNSD